jgi:hypothetical protein
MAIPVSIPQEFTILAGELSGIPGIPEDSLGNQWRTMKNSISGASQTFLDAPRSLKLYLSVEGLCLFIG